jgi:hypothetical protein
MIVRIRSQWAAPLCLALIGCAGAKPNRADISSDDSNERIRAIKAAGEAKDVHAVPLIVDRLEDEDSAVRFFAIIALEKITGQRFGYDYSKAGRDRAASIVLWREYVKSGDFAAKSAAPARGQNEMHNTGDGGQDGIAAGP